MQLRSARSLWRRIAVWSAAVVASGAGLMVPARAAVVNPGFDSVPNGLAGWQVAGSVYNTGQQAVLSDDTAVRSMVWQSVSTGGGPHSLEFDLLAVLAGVGAPGTLPDACFVSLYSFPSPLLFDPVNGAGFSGALAVLDLGPGGVTGAAPGLKLGPSPKGPSYVRVGIEFTPGDAYVAPVFELTNLNFVAADSVVAVDNVTITAVPEPGIGGLLLASLALAMRRRRSLR